MSKQYHIKMDGKLIPVSEEVYRAYQRPKWRENKQKKVRNDAECSYDAMCESCQKYGSDPTQPGVDDIVTDKLLLNALLEAMTALSDDERELVYALFYKGKSERSYAEESGVPRKTLAYRKGKVLEKLRKIIENN